MAKSVSHACGTMAVLWLWVGSDKGRDTSPLCVEFMFIVIAPSIIQRSPHVSVSLLLVRPSNKPENPCGTYPRGTFTSLLNGGDPLLWFPGLGPVSP